MAAVQAPPGQCGSHALHGGLRLRAVSIERRNYALAMIRWSRLLAAGVCDEPVGEWRPDGPEDGGLLGIRRLHRASCVGWTRRVDTGRAV